MIITKTCSICHRELTLENFRKDRTRKDGFHPWCKECQRIKRKESRNNNEIAKEGERRRHKKYGQGKGKETQRKYNQLPKVKAYCKRYRESEAGRKSYERSRLKSKESGYQKRYAKEKWDNDIEYRLVKLLRGRVRATITKGCKSGHTLELLGCSIDELKVHLEQQFEPGMTWDNQGEWHVDHIIPCSRFDLSNPIHQRICFNYRNLQPLWASENSAKRDELPEGWEDLLKVIMDELCISLIDSLK